MSKSSNHNLKICIIFLKSKNRAIRKKTNSVFKRNRQIAETFCKANTDFDVEILTNQATDKIPEKYQFSSLREAFQNKNVKNFDAALTIYNQFEVSPENILNCLKSFEKNPRSIISLTFKYKRRPIALGRKIRIWWSNTYFRFITGIKITGYRSRLRIYPVKPILSIKILSTKATCETELAARYSWRGGNIIEQESENEILDTTCISDSNIPVRQKLRKNLFSASLFIPAILYGLPRRIFHKLKNANLRKMWKEEVLGSNQNNSTLSKSLAFGIFMGLTPIWGWQTVLTLAGSHIMKLNKALAVIASYISLPPFMPIIMFASFYLGALVLGNTFNIDFSRGVNFDLISRNILQYIIGSIILAIAGGIITFLFSIILFKFFRKDKS